MNIILSGYGRMGHEVEKAAIARGHRIIARIDTEDDWATCSPLFSSADVVIDFSQPATAVANIRHCFDHHIPVVTGTTGWNKDEPMVRKWCMDENQSLFVGSNFSIGVNILFALTGKLGELMNRFDEYNISLEEIHHIHKLDAPSGTAIKLAELILSRVERKKAWVNQTGRTPEELQVISVREGEVPGTHTVDCESEADRITLRHEAKNRKGFALGAVMAAEWLPGKKGYFEMNDLLGLTL
ncbi:MAG: 4-hydroxy-tetrahydrodipicolinate reductase [Bacteroidales bacterium]|nr:4-hydroxy-tetrahydrodipicolinate reductase [Bacteroidales bacterium]